MREKGPATLPRVVAPGREQSSQKVSPFSSEDLPDVCQLTERDLILNAGYAVELASHLCVLNLHLSHFYHTNP